MKRFLLVTCLTAIITILVVSCGGGGGGGSSTAEPASGELTVEPATSEVGGQINVSVKISDVTSNLAVKIRVPQALQYELQSARIIAGNQSYSAAPTVDVDLPEESSSSSSTSSKSSSSSSSTASSSSSTSSSSTSSTSSSSSSSSSSTSSSSSSTASKLANQVVLAVSGTVTPTPVPEVPKRMLVFYIPASIFVGLSSAELDFSFRATDLVPSGRVELDIDVDNPDIPNSTEFSVSNPLFGAEDAIGIRVKN